MQITERFTRYTRFVGLGKRALWALTGMLLVAVIAVAWINSRDEGARLNFTALPANAPAPDPASMERAVYQGVDEMNRPFTLTADRATQPSRDIVDLYTLTADMMLDKSAWVSLNAGRGHYDMPKKVLDLSEAVSLYYEGGYEFRSPTARLYIDKGEAEGNEPVEGQGPAGILKADRFKILDRGAILRFNGNVYVKLYR